MDCFTLCISYRTAPSDKCRGKYLRIFFTNINLNAIGKINKNMRIKELITDL